jgi:hypothetical protein
MPTYFTFHGIKIQLFHNDHAPPHFHAVAAEYEIIVSIKSMEIMRGNMPNKKRKQVLPGHGEIRIFSWNFGMPYNPTNKI